MSNKEWEQAKVFEQVKQGIITRSEAAARLRITDRWARTKIKRYLQSEDFGLAHRSRGRASPRRWNAVQEKLLIDLLRGEWHDFGPTLAAEKLEEIHAIKVSREVVRKAMIRANLWKPKEKRSKHRERRERKPMLGMMIQLDGSPHDWFEGRAGKCTLLVYIDDATSKILWLEFAESESVVSVMKATKGYVQMHGIPQSFYTDHGSVFHVNLNNPEEVKKTQWERACGQLGIAVHHANSPQAKGRVERCNQTMQDRLVKELRLAGISSIEAANEYLRTSNFIEKHNAKFAVKPTQQGDAHAAPLLHDLNDVFSIYETRTLTNDFTITYQKRIFQLHRQQRTIIRPKNQIIIKISLSDELGLWIRKTELAFNEICDNPTKIVEEDQLIDPTHKKPSKNTYLLDGNHPQSRVKPAMPAAEAS